MITNPQFEAALPAVGPAALAEVKARLQHDYERAYPALAEIIHLVLDEEEANAKKLSLPLFLLPDLVAAHIEKLNLYAVRPSHDGDSAPLRIRIVDAPLSRQEASSREELSANAPQLRAA